MTKTMHLYTSKLHIAAFVLHTISAILLILAGPDGEPATFAGSSIPWMRPITLLAVNETITAVFHAVGIAIYWWTEDHERQADYDSRRRWTEYSVTAFLVEAAILQAQGQSDFNVVVMVFVLNLITQLMGRVIDEHLAEGKDIRMAYFVVPLVAFLAIAMEIISQGQYPLFIVLYTILYGSFAVHQLLVILQTKKLIDFYKWDTDEVYVLLSITTKLVLSWILTAAIGPTEWVRWDIFEWLFLMVMGTVLVGGMYILRDPDAREQRMRGGTSPRSIMDFKVINF